MRGLRHVYWLDLVLTTISKLNDTLKEVIIVFFHLQQINHTGVQSTKKRADLIPVVSIGIQMNSTKSISLCNGRTWGRRSLG